MPHIPTTHPIHQILQRHHRLRVRQLACNSSHRMPWCLGQHITHCRQCRLPFTFLQMPLCILHHWTHQSLIPKPIKLISSLIRYPLLINALIQTRQDSHHFISTSIHTDIRPQPITRINTIRAPQLPASIRKRSRFGRQCTHRAQIHHIPRQLRLHCLLHIRPNLCISPSPSNSQILNPSNLLCKTNTTSTMNTSGHHRLHQRPEILILNRPLHLCKPAPIRPKHHGLILQITLPTLIANRTIERMIRQQKLHHTLPSLLHERRIRLDVHPRVGRHGTRRHGFWRFLHLDQTHTTISSN
mmetsp:Transcript_12376/g.24882  ORF Transcript_12376/g.24882 Transcript_12376/m.24882 type:complete len:299 (-) Transcript_12376:312-1208(-)